MARRQLFMLLSTLLLGSTLQAGSWSTSGHFERRGPPFQGAAADRLVDRPQLDRRGQQPPGDRVGEPLDALLSMRSVLAPRVARMQPHEGGPGGVGDGVMVPGVGHLVEDQDLLDDAQVDAVPAGSGSPVAVVAVAGSRVTAVEVLEADVDRTETIAAVDDGRVLCMSEFDAPSAGDALRFVLDEASPELVLTVFGIDDPGIGWHPGWWAGSGARITGSSLFDPSAREVLAVLDRPGWYALECASGNDRGDLVVFEVLAP